VVGKGDAANVHHKQPSCEDAVIAVELSHFIDVILEEANDVKFLLICATLKDFYHAHFAARTLFILISQGGIGVFRVIMIIRILGLIFRLLYLMLLSRL